MTSLQETTEVPQKYFKHFIMMFQMYTKIEYFHKLHLPITQLQQYCISNTVSFTVPPIPLSFTK